MDLLLLILIFIGLFGVYDAIRTVNNNILKQTREIKKINEHLKQINEKSITKLNVEEE
jgi:glycine betaine/choline ABC-type transport system substrate-binding protein